MSENDQPQNGPRQPRDDTDRLIASYLDGTLGDDQFAVLSGLLHERPELLARVAELSQLDRMIADELSHADRVELVMVEPGDGIPSSLPADDSGETLAQLAAMEADAGEIELVDITERVKQQRLDKERAKQAKRQRLRLAVGRPEVARTIVIPKVAVWGSIAAVLFIGLAMFAIGTRSNEQASEQVAEQPTHRPADPLRPASPTPVATLTYTQDAVWSHPGHAPVLNARLVPGPLRLESGIAHFVMDCGAVLMIQGPAVVDLDNAWVAELSEGSAVARVPEQAHGFKVVGEGFVVTDLGTEFAVRVSDAGVQCRVVLGEVELATQDPAGPGNAVETLRENRLVAIDPATGVVSELEHTEADDIAWALPYAALLNQNLVVNGGFEDGQFGVGGAGGSATNVLIPGWEEEDGPATVLDYEQVGSLGEQAFPDPGADPMPENRGRGFYVGGSPGTISQDIDLSGLAEFAKTGQARFVFSADLGGLTNQNDYARVLLEFRNAGGRVIRQVELDPVDAQARRNQSGFIHRSLSGSLPTGAVLARIHLIAVHGRGGLTDAYADNISLVVEADTPETHRPRAAGPAHTGTNEPISADALSATSNTPPAVSRAGLGR